jgi:hypothetical protein
MGRTDRILAALAVLAIIGIGIGVACAPPMTPKKDEGKMALTWTSPVDFAVVGRYATAEIGGISGALAGDAVQVANMSSGGGMVGSTTLTAGQTSCTVSLDFGAFSGTADLWCNHTRDGSSLGDDGPPHHEVTVNADWIHLGSSDADAALWDDASKHRYSKFGDAGGGYKNVDTGATGNGPGSLAVQFFAPSITGGYKVNVLVDGYLWHQETGLQGNTTTVSASLGCGLPWAKDSTWCNLLGHDGGAKTITLELRKADNTLVASDTAAWTMFVPAVSFTSPAGSSDVSAQVGVAVAVDEWYAPSPAQVTVYAGGITPWMRTIAVSVVSGTPINCDLPGKTGSATIVVSGALFTGCTLRLAAYAVGARDYYDGGEAGTTYYDTTRDFAYVGDYGIVIDTPADGATVSGSMVDVAGRLTGALTGVIRIYHGRSYPPIAEMAAAATWGPYNVPIGEIDAVQGIYAEGDFGTIFVDLATAAVFVLGSGVETGGGGGATEPTVTLDLPADGATVGPSCTALVKYDGFTGGSGTLTITLIGGGSSWELLSAARTVGAGPGSYAEVLAMPEGLAEGDYTILARLNCGAETDSDSHAVTYAEAGGGGGTPPTVTIETPADASSAHGTVDVTATVTATAGIYQVACYVDGALLGVLKAPNSGTDWIWPWDSQLWANGSHEIRVLAIDADMLEGSAAVTVNLTNSKAERSRLWFTDQLGTDESNVALNAESAGYGGVLVRAMMIPRPQTLPVDVGSLYNLEFGYIAGENSTSKLWADTTIVADPHHSFLLQPAGSRTVRWFMSATPRQTVASWDVSAEAITRLGTLDNGDLVVLCTGPFGIARLTSSGLSVWADLSTKVTAAADMCVCDGKVFVADGEWLQVVDQDTGDLGAAVRIDDAELETITALATDGSRLFVAADLTGGGSRVYAWTWPRTTVLCSQEHSITALAWIGGQLYGGNDAGEVLRIGTSASLEYSTGEAVIRRIVARDAQVLAGTGEDGKLFARDTNWRLAQDFGWDQVKGLATANGWLWAGGNGTGGQYLWYEGNAGWIETLALDAVGINDLLTVNGQLFAATTGSDGASKLFRVEIADAGKWQMGEKFPDVDCPVLETI